MVLPVLGLRFRGRFWARCGRKADAKGPTCGLKMPGPSARVVWDRPFQFALQPQPAGTGSIVKQPKVSVQEIDGGHGPGEPATSHRRPVGELCQDVAAHQNWRL